MNNLSFLLKNLKVTGASKENPFPPARAVAARDALDAVCKTVRAVRARAVLVPALDLILAVTGIPS